MGEFPSGRERTRYPRLQYFRSSGQDLRVDDENPDFITLQVLDEGLRGDGIGNVTPLEGIGQHPVFELVAGAVAMLHSLRGISIGSRMDLVWPMLAWIVVFLLGVRTQASKVAEKKHGS